MDEGTRGVGGSPDGDVSRLEHRAEAIRENLGELVDELDHRRHRAVKPLLIAAAAVAGLGLAAVIVSRRRRRPPSRAREVALAIQRLGQHPERVAQAKPLVGKQIAAAAGAALVAVVVRRLAQSLIKVPAM
jgi:hypothetical protein